MFSFRKKFHLVIVCTANRTRSAYLASYLNHYLSQYRSSALKRIKIPTFKLEKRQPKGLGQPQR